MNMICWLISQGHPSILYFREFMDELEAHTLTWNLRLEIEGLPNSKCLHNHCYLICSSCRRSVEWRMNFYINIFFTEIWEHSIRYDASNTNNRKFYLILHLLFEVRESTIHILKLQHILWASSFSFKRCPCFIFILLLIPIPITQLKKLLCYGCILRSRSITLSLGTAYSRKLLDPLLHKGIFLILNYMRAHYLLY